MLGAGLYIMSVMALAPIAGDTLQTVEVIGQRPQAQALQVLSGAELERLSSHSVADAIRYFGGVEVKDYGGVGGVKTVNVRSMGASHVGVTYDGVALGNAQNGQIDLGQFGLDNIEEISLTAGRQPRLLQPAREFGAAAQVAIKTRRPVFNSYERPWRLKAQLSGGSFDFIGGGIMIESRLSQRVNTSLNINVLNASGQYKFRLREFTPSGALAYDTTAVRQNGDIFATRVETNFHGTLSIGSWSAKAYTYYSNRGVPGAIVANVWRRGERLRDSNSFVQGSYSGMWGRWKLLCNAKYAFYNTYYKNNDTRTITTAHRYRQHEGYVSAAAQFNILSNWAVNLSYDLQFNRMNADLTGFKTPERWTNMIAAGSELQLRSLIIQAAALTTLVTDKVDRQNSFIDAFTPSLSINWQPLGEFQLRAMGKRSFRMPTFNDLYYTDAGNAYLKPERVSQVELGFVFERQRSSQLLELIRLSLDGFFNRVSDKIISYPKGQQFRWTMLNLGEVDIRGLEAGARLVIAPLPEWHLGLRGQYTLQRSIDITDPADSYYRNQIPYTPRHSASATAMLRWRMIQLNYSFLYVGQRWNQQENIPRNLMRPWHTSDLSLSADLRNWRIQFEVNNLADQHYAVILNYPMPGRNFRITLTYSL